MSQEAFAKRLGVTGASISKIESGQRKLTGQMILLICREFNINETWLRYGEGEMYKSMFPSEISQLLSNYNLDELDTKIIGEYLLLDPSQRKVIKEYITKVTSYDSRPVNTPMNMNLLRDGTVTGETLHCAENSGNMERS
ncbi:MAG TPA: helix-turn-helix domain-containing protein [Clostridiales bacterium]|nr:helix-turn-helix domain-containing protein [Clostridiales bacterium]